LEAYFFLAKKPYTGGRTYLVGEEVILVGDQQDGGKKRPMKMEL
jgi:hypothetical protein